MPDQNSFSLSLEKLAVESDGIDGVTNTITVRLADHFNNPVPEGTIVNFTTEGGTVPASCVTDATGACSVDWVSSNPRPADHRVTILAYAIGNETLYDINGNGVFDDGDSFDDVGEVFRDDDKSGAYNPVDSSFSQKEKLFDYDGNGIYSAGDGVYNGVFCNHSSLCPASSDNLAGRSNLLLNISAQATMIMTASYPTVELYRNNAGSDSCFDSNGKLRAGCDIVSNHAFIAGASQRFNALIADSVVKCSDGSGNRVESTDPNDVACIVVERQSTANGASIAISSGIGIAPTSLPSLITKTVNHIERSFVLVSSDDNAEVETGELKLTVTMPESNTTVEALINLTDSVN